jgi:HEPN domain-containing protein
LLTFAAEDLAYGQLGVNELPRAAAWCFQQAVEKSLKALWLLTFNDIPRTHDVAFLLSELVPRFEPPAAIRDATLLIAQITPAVRYPSDDMPVISPRDAAEFAEAANLIVTWASERIIA